MTPDNLGGELMLNGDGTVLFTLILGKGCAEELCSGIGGLIT